jgi:hypothetical protein
MTASVSGSTELVASSNNSTLHPLTSALTSATKSLDQYFLSIDQVKPPLTQLPLPSTHIPTFIQHRRIKLEFILHCSRSFTAIMNKIDRIIQFRIGT